LIFNSRQTYVIRQTHFNYFGRKKQKHYFGRTKKTQASVSLKNHYPFASMLRFSYIVTFILCVALAAFGILLSESLRREHPDKRRYTQLIFQQAFVYVFAFYGIGGHFLFSLLLQAERTYSDLIGKMSFILFVFAIPFLLLSWWFFFQIVVPVRFPSQNKRIVLLFYLATLILSASTLFLLPTDKTLFEKSIYVISLGNMLINGFAALFLFLSRNAFPNGRLKTAAGLVFFGIAALSASAAFFSLFNSWVSQLYLLFFFASFTWLPVLFRYIIGHKSEPAIGAGEHFEGFCAAFGISKREAEIIVQICEGRTNKEIAEKLFITLQTVKDHTSRIYLKTGVRNRTELSNRVRAVLPNPVKAGS